MIVGLSVLASGCSTASTGTEHATSTTNRAAAPVSTPTSGRVGSATPPFQIAQASIEVSATTATIKFAGPVVTAPLRVTGVAFDGNRKRLTFLIVGVAYTGREISVSGSPGDLISRLTALRSRSGMDVQIDLNHAGSSPAFTVSGNQVSVDFSG